ncbi:MAG TPA: phosphoribosylaminoimidazolesuccinocarboxamide synthase [candidate division Zixibacteria bacterium]|nr:phosphoribosylaminoimidazolesuccinocarboxamide synthase [candidate division Zixibacteria bacterium]
MEKDTLPGLTLFGRGKVRDIYDFGDRLLLVATDRISAFDVVLPTEIPDKGRVLTALSAYWFGVMQDIVPHHMISIRPDDFPPACRPHREWLDGRAMLVRKAKPVPVECIIRGYLAGSGWKEYRETGRVCGVELPPGLPEAARLEEPIFTPSTKAPVGEHDVNITFDQMAERIGVELARAIRDTSIAIYRRAREMAEARGILIADTKLEFGLDGDRLILIDELLTPDSSRFWPAEGYRPGKTPDSFDKQYVRDYLLSLGWDMKPPAPELPPEVVSKTREKYNEALRRLTGA